MTPTHCGVKPKKAKRWPRGIRKVVAAAVKEFERKRGRRYDQVSTVPWGANKRVPVHSTACECGLPVCKYRG